CSALFTISYSLPGTILQLHHQRDGVTQLQSIVIVTEGEDVSLQCNYTGASDGSDYLFWYRHLTNKAPEYILRTSTNNRNKDHADFAKERFSTNVSKSEKTVPLNILHVRVADSAGYYCALSPTEAQISGSALQKLPCGVLQLNGYSTRLTSERRWFNSQQNETFFNFSYCTHTSDNLGMLDPFIFSRLNRSPESSYSHLALSTSH
uniref:Ig-like domain-containing protein n=1 Tax=Callorhinchus milii TaxID=7868 RepID=A0A4W3GDI1_CALMI